MGSCRKFIGDSEGRLQSVMAEKPSRKRVQEGSAVKSTRMRMEHVFSELRRLVEGRLGQRSTK
jgi:hypothetical protein